MGEMIKGAVLFPGTDRILPSSHAGPRGASNLSLPALPPRLVLAYLCSIPEELG